jgi:hypothetical protein
MTATVQNCLATRFTPVALASEEDKPASIVSTQINKPFEPYQQEE